VSLALYQGSLRTLLAGQLPPDVQLDLILSSGNTVILDAANEMPRQYIDSKQRTAMDPGHRCIGVRALRAGSAVGHVTGRGA
jgi:hypothetical protein